LGRQRRRIGICTAYHTAAHLDLEGEAPSICSRTAGRTSTAGAWWNKGRDGEFPCEAHGGAGTRAADFHARRSAEQGSGRRISTVSAQHCPDCGHLTGQLPAQPMLDVFICTFFFCKC
jgi:hypothetical protein